MKKCSRCGETKLVDRYPRRSSARDGRASWCKDCFREYAQAHREQSRERTRRWAAKNPEKLRAYERAHRAEALERGRRYDQRNREARLAKSARWLAEHPDWNREKSHRRRALERGSAVEPVDRQAIYDRDNGTCHLCDKPVDRADFTLDHIIPIALGGPHTPANVAVAHGTCNFRRGTRSVEEYRAIA